MKVAQKCCSMQGRETLGALGPGFSTSCPRGERCCRPWGQTKHLALCFPAKITPRQLRPGSNTQLYIASSIKMPKQKRFCHLTCASTVLFHKAARGRLRGGCRQAEAPPWLCEGAPGTYRGLHPGTWAVSSSSSSFPPLPLLPTQDSGTTVIRVKQVRAILREQSPKQPLRD